MLRVVLSVLAVVVAVLAIVLEEPALYAAAAILLLMAIVLVAAAMRRRHQEAQRSYASQPSPQPASRQDELESLGIMEIRAKPREEAPGADGNGAATRPMPPQKVYGLPAEDVVEERAPVAAAEAAAPLPEEEPAPAPAAPTPEVEEAPPPEVLQPYLRAVRAVLEAQMVCLLKQEDIALEYQVVACTGAQEALEQGRVFSAPAPLLTAHGARQPVTVRTVGEGELSPDSLGYRSKTDAVCEVALSPVPGPLDHETYFLLADTDVPERLRNRRTHALLAQFAALLGMILAAPEPEETTDEAFGAAVQRAPRPRREIIAEEMQHARARQHDLALALVYLNRAEDVAGLGETAVEAAERQLADHLLHVTPLGRVIRFGELTYGVFFDGPVLEVEAWSARVQHDFARARGVLEGGVSIGIAMLQDRHQRADDFRADATVALREAFESGTCTILE